MMPRSGAALNGRRALSRASWRRCTLSRSPRRNISRAAHCRPTPTNSPTSKESSGAHRARVGIREHIMRNAAGTEIPVKLAENDCLRRSGSDLPGSPARPRCDIDRDEPRATAFGARCARASRPPMVQRRWADLHLFPRLRTLLPAKTRVFVDFVVEALRRDRLTERLAGSLG